jgi:hypothetical protein
MIEIDIEKSFPQGIVAGYTLEYIWGEAWKVNDDGVEVYPPQRIQGELAAINCSLILSEMPADIFNPEVAVKTKQHDLKGALADLYTTAFNGEISIEVNIRLPGRWD